MGPSGSLKDQTAPVNVAVGTLLFYACLAWVHVAEGHSPLSSITTTWRQTLHFPMEMARNELRHLPHVIDAHAFKSAVEKEARHWGGKFRARRAANDSVDPNHRTTIADLTDSHTTLMVHWAGEGSHVIIALAKNAGENNSCLFVSRDYGKTFTNVSSQLKVNWTTNAVISNYYSARSFNNYYVFTDEINKCMFTTDNTGENFVRHCDLPFAPRVVKLNRNNPRLILAMDDQSRLKQLYLSEDFGETWKEVYTQVKSFYWGIPPYDSDSTIFVVEELPPSNGQTAGRLQIVRSDSLFHFSYSTAIVLTDVLDFDIRDDYMYATKSVYLIGSRYNPHLQLWVSYMRGDFVNAEFPGNYVFTDFYVADASEGQLMVCALINNSHSNLYVSEVTGFKFSLSLEKIVYFNPKTMPSIVWLRLYANETFVDITKLHGVSGIYIASQQTGDVLDVEAQQSLITYDKGATWQRIKAPEYGIGNQPTYCKMSENCSLHLTQEFHKLYQGSQAYPILTQSSSPGLVIASGFMAKTLKSNPDVFVSSNAGISWRQVLSGNYFYASADHGGIIVAVHQFVPTDKVVYSIDEGETWHTYTIVSEKIRVYGLLTEPGENSTVFSIFGSPRGPHRWQIIQVDFKDVFEGKKCGPSDYKMWSVGEDLPNGTACLLGHVMTIQRRIAHAVCYNGDYFVRQSLISNCSCRRQDFECDYGFQNVNGRCHRDTSVTDAAVYQITTHCPPGAFYSYTRGYRKIAGDTCAGGEDHRFGPLQYSCPIQERTEFLLVTLDFKVQMIDLASGARVDLLDEHVADVPVTFDYEKNCLIYVSVLGDMKRKCFVANDPSSVVNHEIIHRSRNNTQITSMAFDWTGRNVYYTDSNNSIHVVNVDWRYERTLYTVKNRVYSPRGITVDPHHGYLFFVGSDSTSQTISIFRAAMDGSSDSAEVVIRNNVTIETSLTIDLDTESLYWVTPKTATGYTSDIHGQTVNVLFTETANFIAIYKNDVYIATKSGFGILMANKHSPSSWRYFVFTSGVRNMLVVSNTSQHASSACSAYHTPCSQLCLPHPDPSSHNRTCLCGDSFPRSVQPPSRDETCRCENGERMVNQTCIKGTNTSCALDKLACGNGNCILLNWKCDGEDDCGDGTDEIDCPFTTCSSSSFTCRTGKCIPKQWVCDQQDDCKDGIQSDELNCPNRTCSHDQFKCDNGFCINRQWVCDIDDDCHDNSDEKNCYSHNNTCPPWSFTCENGTCIDLVYKCNGHQDCSDNSDEKNCHNHTCSDYQFDCGNGEECIYEVWRCDGEADCKNGTDEIGCVLNTTPAPRNVTGLPYCPIFSYKCTNGYCVGWVDVCNGINDCGDSSDEIDCEYPIFSTTTPPAMWNTTSPTNLCSYNEFLCPLDHRCLPSTKRCDGHEDCLDGTDEDNCGSCSRDQYQCAHSKCIWKAWVCDGEADCPQGDDESLCDNHTTTCQPREFQCTEDGGCISASKVCDKVVDCNDGSDEKQCHVHTVMYNCKVGQFNCNDTSRTCLASVQVCNRRPECANGRDEQDCDACLQLDAPSTLYSSFEVSSTSVQFKIFYDFTNLSFAKMIKDLSMANLTWTNKVISEKDHSLFSVKDLQPHATYHFAFSKMIRGVTCIVKSYEIVTAEGIPSAPRNLSAAVKVENYPVSYAVDLSWMRPLLTNGDIQYYTIYYQLKNASGKPLLGVFSQRSHVQDSERADKQIYRDKVPDVQPDYIYDFWVTASTLAGESVASEKFTVKVIRAIDTNLNITVTDLAETSFTLKWNKATNALGYQITVRFQEDANFPAATVSDMILHAQSSQTSVAVTGLCPGTTVYVSLQIVNADNSTGPKILPYNTTRENGEIHLKGTKPVATFTDIDLVGPTLVLLKYNSTQGGSYPKQYFIHYTHDENTAAINQTTPQSSHQLAGLFACQKYLVWIQPAFPTCPFTDLRNISTMEDITAPPKNVQVNVSRVQEHFSMNITWKPSCSENSPLAEGYIVRIKVGEKEAVEYLTARQEFFLPYVQDGTYYVLTVRTDQRGSQETAPYSTFISYVGKPFNIVPVFDGNNATISWRFPPAADKENKFKHFMVEIKCDDVEISNTTKDSEISILMWKDGRYFITITAMAESNRVIGEPGTYEFPYRHELKSPNTDAVISLSKINLVAILVPVIFVIVALSAGLVFFIVRHNRLQRSFLAFANSHYNIQSGTTTFSEDLGLDGDEPLIQGFSDDEPLVIA